MGTPSLTMDSAVPAILLASLLAAASAQWSPDCALQEAFCDPDDAQYDEGALSDPSIDLAAAAGECYDLCFAEKDDPTSPCMDFTVMKLGARPARCYLLRESCIKNIVDDCIALGNAARLVSQCGVDGAWTEAQNFDGELAYPAYPAGASSYPTPDAIEADALPCGCPPLEVKWPYEDPAGFYYDPNAEPAADFICDTPVDTEGMTTYNIETTNTCVLYCDDHYVATAKCQNGEWLGNPEWGFWCYEEPTAIDGGNGGGGDVGDGV